MTLPFLPDLLIPSVRPDATATQKRPRGRPQPTIGPQQKSQRPRGWLERVVRGEDLGDTPAGMANELLNPVRAGVQTRELANMAASRVAAGAPGEAVLPGALALAGVAGVGPAAKLPLQAVPELKAMWKAMARADAPPLPKIAAVDEAAAARMAKVYESLPVNQPEAKEAYAALVDEVEQQFQALQKAGYRFEFVDTDPYPGGSREMIEDVAKNRRLKVFKTPEDDFHPFLTPEQNNKFRAVHDALAHAGGGNQFGPKGEELAYRIHARTLSPLARRALATETRGQNSWVNFGPNRHLPVKERPFAQQKAALWPEEFIGDYDSFPPEPTPDEDWMTYAIYENASSAIPPSEWKPAVYYHGTGSPAGISAFEVGRPAINGYGLLGDVETSRRAIFLAEDPAVASEFAMQRPPSLGRPADPQRWREAEIPWAPQVLPVHVRAQQVADLATPFTRGELYRIMRNDARTPDALKHLVSENLEYPSEALPLWRMFDDDFGAAENIAWWRRHGYDAVRFRENDGAAALAVFDPRQIKSKFNPAPSLFDPDIMRD